MKTIIRAFALAAVAFAWTLPGHAQAPSGVEILHQKVVQQGGRTVTYNIVTPPPDFLPPRPPSQETAEATPVSPAELHALQEQAQKPVKSYVVEGTVYPGGIAEIRWHHGNTAYRAFSNADFMLFPAMTVLEAAEEVYQFTFLLTHSAELPAGAPAPSQFSTEQAEYLVVATSQAAIGQEVAAFVPFDALHVFYDNAKADLLAAKAASDAAQTAREQEQQNAPPPPQDTTINLWPVKSRLYLSEDAE